MRFLSLCRRGRLHEVRDSRLLLGGTMKGGGIGMLLKLKLTRKTVSTSIALAWNPLRSPSSATRAFAASLTDRTSCRGYIYSGPILALLDHTFSVKCRLSLKKCPVEKGLRSSGGLRFEYALQAIYAQGQQYKGWFLSKAFTGWAWVKLLGPVHLPRQAHLAP